MLWPRVRVVSLLAAHLTLGLGVLLVGAGCGGSGADPNNLTPAQQQNIEDELKSSEALQDQPPSDPAFRTRIPGRGPSAATNEV